jgi:hypothetical protein
MESDPNPVTTGAVAAGTTPSRFREYASDALRYWELRRIPYNFLLAGIVVLRAMMAEWPDRLDEGFVPRLMFLVVLAVLANIAYSVVYLPDLFIQYSGLRSTRRIWRWAFIIAGFGLAAALTYLFSGGLVGGDSGRDS